MIMSVFSIPPPPFAIKMHVRRIMYKHSRAFLAEKDTRVIHQGLSLFSITAPRTEDVAVTVYPWACPGFDTVENVIESN